MSTLLIEFHRWDFVGMERAGDGVPFARVLHLGWASLAVDGGSVIAGFRNGVAGLTSIRERLGALCGHNNSPAGAPAHEARKGVSSL